MKKIAVVIPIFILLMLSAMSPLVHATKPTYVSGNWIATPPPPVFTNPKVAGSNFFVDLHNHGSYTTGDIQGTFTQENTMIWHFGNPKIIETIDLTKPTTWPDSETNWKIERSFTGTVLGKSGTFEMQLEGKGYGRLNAMTLKGTWIIISGTGDLANLHGQGTWTIVSPTLSYEGQVHFDP